ncbi:MAG: hypothetical protein U1U88_000845 [Lawsonella clevelandensis]
MAAPAATSNLENTRPTPADDPDFCAKVNVQKPSLALYFSLQ